MCRPSLDNVDLLQASKTVLQLLVCIGLPIIFVYHIEVEEGIRNQSVLKMSLPPPDQLWVHAVDNRRKLLQALEDDKVTAIETDLLMGTHNGEGETIPIMAHPPSTTSDLPMTDFLQLVSSHNANGVHKVIKLDFKQAETVEPTLKALVDLNVKTAGENAIVYLNADILPGPGKREEGVVTIHAKKFVETCVSYMEQSSARIAFSLGYKTDYQDSEGYTEKDVQAMTDLIAHYRLVEQNIGVVLALNARLLAKSLVRFDSILTKYPPIQILAWTGKGEPPIPKDIYEYIQLYYQEKEMSQRIGYDCQVSSS